MPFGGLLTAGLGSAFGGLAGLFGGGKQQQTQTNGTITNNQTGTFNQSGTQTTTPNLNPLQSALMKQFTQGASNLYNQSTNLQPYTSSGLENINATQNANSKAIAANLASRGLSWSPAAGSAQTQNILAGGQQKASFMNSIPLLQRQLQENSLGDLENAFKTMPIGQTATSTSSGTTTQQGTQTQQGTNLVSGNPMAGLFSGLGAGTIASLPIINSAINGTGNGLAATSNSLSNNIASQLDPNSFNNNTDIPLQTSSYDNGDLSDWLSGLGG